MIDSYQKPSIFRPTDAAPVIQKTYGRIVMASLFGSVLAGSLITANNNEAEGVVECYKFVTKWGSQGNEDGQFDRPHDLDLDP